MTDQPQRGGSRSLNYGLVALVVAIILVFVQLGALVFPRRDTRVAVSDVTATRPPRPTRTLTPMPPTNTVTNTPVPPTSTPTYTATPVPPTPTPLPPTETPVPPTETPVPTDTPIPPTPKPRAPTATRVPPTAPPPPLTVLDRMDLNNGEWGTGWLMVKYEDDMYANGSDGHRYRLELGLLSSSQAQKRIQDFWGYGARGSANWTMTIMVRETVNWVSCSSSDNICYEGSAKSSQANFTAQVYYKPKVWESLLNDYLAGGLQRTFSNGYYKDVQASIFKPMCNCDAVPELPCIGFKFTRVD